MRAIPRPIGQSRLGLELFCRLTRTALYLFVLGGAIVILIPFAWAVSTALKTPEQIYIVPPRWIPNPVAWRNFYDGWTAMPFTLYLRNTLIITTSCIVGEIVSCSIVAFAFARLRFRGRGVLFLLVLSTMMLPAQVTMIPTYILFGKLHWIDTFAPLIVPGFFATTPFYIFLLRQFFMTIPLELDEAARIDGCGHLRTFAQITLPMSKAALFVIVLLSFVGHWNDFMGPLIYLNSERVRTLVLGLAYFVTSELEGVTQLPYLMAVNLLAMLPCIALFACFQRQFIQGVVITGVKG